MFREFIKQTEPKNIEKLFLHIDNVLLNHVGSSIGVPVPVASTVSKYHTLSMQIKTLILYLHGK
jgi:hypothetical protein